MGLIQPGSLDLEEVQLRIGGIQLVDRTPLTAGVKFVVVEHGVDKSGAPVEEAVFDHRRMCYSLLLGPEDTGDGRHRRIPEAHVRAGLQGGIRVTGGGVAQVRRDRKLNLEGDSVQYSREPNYLRAQFAQMLLEPIRQISGYSDVTLEEHNTSMYYGCVNAYWLRYRQVLEAMQTKFRDSPYFIREQLEQFERLR